MSSAAFAQGAPAQFGFGAAVTPQELAGYFSILPDGRGLPPDGCPAADGATIFAENCAACHGEKLEGNPAVGIGGDRLLGGRGSLATKTPVETVESYLPYATALFDLHQACHAVQCAGSLKDDEVYALVAFICPKERSSNRQT